MDTTSGMLETTSGVLLEERKTLEARKRAFAFEEEARKLDGQIDIEIANYFSPGVYARAMFMPAGCVIVGKIHKYPQLNILSKGDVTVAMDDGPERVKAGWHKVCPAGAKRVFYAHEDSIWTVILHTNETDVDIIENHFVAESEQEYLEFRRTLE